MLVMHSIGVTASWVEKIEKDQKAAPPGQHYGAMVLLVLRGYYIDVVRG